MNLVLAFDSETTGIPIWSEPSDSETQPHLVQLAAVLVDLDTGTHYGAMDVIIRPDGWTIPDDVLEIHGITTEHALEVGIPEETALAMFMALAEGRCVLGYNTPFDKRMIRIALKRYTEGEAQMDAWKDCESLCAMQAARKDMGVKSIKLTEAYRLYMGRELVGAHSAMADTLATIDVYREILRGQAPVTPAPVDLTGIPDTY